MLKIHFAREILLILKGVGFGSVISFFDTLLISTTYAKVIEKLAFYCGQVWQISLNAASLCR